MNAQQVREAFTAALTLKPGQSIEIPCEDEKNQNSARTLLYRERKSFGLIVDAKLANSLQIGRFKRDETFFVEIKKNSDLATSGIVIRELDGTTKPLDLLNASGALDDALNIDDEIQRIVHLMKEDGKSQEEIDAYLEEV